MMTLHSLAKQVENIPHDIRAEIIVNELIQNKKIAADKIIISNEGQFSRSYRYDVTEASVIDDNFDREEYIKLSLSRDSLYDTLPEGVVHSSSFDSKERSVAQMIEEHKILKDQENEARKFFSPFENEIFNYRVKIENIERDFLYKLNGSKPVDFFYDFWGLSHDFPANLVAKFIRLLPYAYRIVGDIELSCSFLSNVLEEQVRFESYGYKEHFDSSENFDFGESRLGVDLICGNSFIDYSLNITIEIGPIVNNNFSQYINNGPMQKFIDCFYEHFFPLEVEIRTILLINHEEEEFDFNKTSVLGYSTRI
jgi:hypothetical protein